MYVTTPDNSTQSTDTAVLYLTDVFGINLTENRLYVIHDEKKTSKTRISTKQII